MTEKSTDTASALLEATMRELDEVGYAGVSLRAVARRAGVSHAAPKYFYGDRSGLMAAAATVGFEELAREVRRAASADSAPLAGAGRAYLGFARRRPALFDLMFRPTEVDNDNAELNAARGDALAALNEIVDPDAARRGVLADTTLTSWAFVHGLAALARDGALAESVTGTESAADIADRLLRLGSGVVVRPSPSDEAPAS